MRQNLKQNLVYLMRGATALALLITISACTPAPQGGSGTGNTTATGWKEGYGGDSIALEAVRIIEKVCFRVQGLRKPLLQRALNTDKDIAGPLCDLLKPNELVIESVDQPKVNGIDKDAANYPDARPRRLEIKKAYWPNPKVSDDAREELLLHELLPLVGLEDKDYVRSSRLRIALQATGGRFLDLRCEAAQIQAILAGANPDLIRHYSRELGKMNCREALEILREHRANKTFDPDTLVDLQHGYTLGIFLSMARSMDDQLIAKAEMLFMESALALDSTFSYWSPDLCREMGSKLRKQQRCGGLAEYMVGASRTQKLIVTIDERGAFDFDRAALMLMHKLRGTRSSKIINGFLQAGSRVDADIVKAAIRTQNWAALNFLGLLQRDINSLEEPSALLLQNISWVELLESAIRLGLDSEDPNLQHLHMCAPANLLQHSEFVINGGFSKIACEANYTI